MLNVAKFTFNPFQENTYVLHDGSQAMVIDPGCWNASEEHELETYLTDNALTPVRLVLTHAHIDHILGNAWAHNRYGLLPEMHAADLPLLRGGPRQASLYGVHLDPSPEPEHFIAEGDTLSLGDHALKILFVPGHAPGHIALFSAEQRFVIAGDVLFMNSIGRTDLPGGDTDTLLRSIREQLFPLGDDVKVYCGHGPDTTIGHEKRSNPFLR
ncbi:MAG TPA: MBL fold metallo-hydrolase [Flavobacteriales bacterium]|nr:MBL fold metallo-hydrolase [Flavobacteriales bacterium]